MTPEQRTQFRTLLSRVINAAIAGSYADQLAHEDHLTNYVIGLQEERDTEKGQTFADYIGDDVPLDPIAEEFCQAMDAAWADGVGVPLSQALRRWRSGELIISQIARLIDESDWPLTDRLARAHKAYMLDWEGPGYEGRHA